MCETVKAWIWWQWYKWRTRHVINWNAQISDAQANRFKHLAKLHGWTSL